MATTGNADATAFSGLFLIGIDCIRGSAEAFRWKLSYVKFNGGLPFLAQQLCAAE